MASLASRATPAFAPLQSDSPVEATFYLGGQPYIVDSAQPLPPELAEFAITETAEQYTRLMAFYHAGTEVPEEGRTLTDSEWRLRASELMMGIAALSVYVNPLLPHIRRVLRTIGVAVTYLTGIFIAFDT